ncbi:MAG: cell division protein FtsZ [Desulfovibrionaceae bacterium]|nr:cell division protein FtsZ [Desulfovibrionaceae bacterium]
MEYFELDTESSARIKVVGAGGGGSNAVDNMICSALKGVTFITANTDMQALSKSKAEFRLQIGEKLTKGLGAGANPEVGRDAALESIDLIRETLGDADMVFITAGMGGGTGTGAAPVIAQAAKEIGALTVAVVTKPFYFEGKKRLLQAEKGVQALREVVDSIITIPNDRLLSLASKKATFLEMLKKADEVLYFAVKGISDLIMVPGLINLDFADVKAVMSEMGLAMMGFGVSRGESRAREAALKAITSPLLEDVTIDGARGVLMNITCGPDLTIEEVDEAASTITEAVHEDAKVFFGTVFDQDAGDEMRITVIATGIDSERLAASNAAAAARQAEERHVENVTPISRTRTPGSSGPGGGGVPVQPAGPGSILQSPRAAKIMTSVTANDYNIPAYIRKGVKKTPESAAVQPPVKAHAPGEEEFIFDEEEFEIPSFIRMQAD